jgi:GNAT superfamily N-acetyltransferase
VIRAAGAADVDAIAALIERAYARYVSRIGRRPAPMDADHAGHVARGEQFVLADEATGAVLGAVVLVPRADHLYVDNLAVEPDRHGAGLGRALLAFADAEARRRGLPELRLHTNVKMTENLAIYPHLGWEETGREQVGPYTRVAFRRCLAP